ncbi:MAG: flagellar biosynthesis protein [Thermobacillus sp. ZCTH02-B1]|uniref:TIGR02530 family flagellar biosynthesis protein n=1 Tax=Thermobacillus sp. ZCTH02-B1 TaxID=1858795 RepID=UPI000B55BFB5|nr:TIGR02530 family flagellar biosynthesis protein [Thermobacillus sp. ZCTH02-B1]OUM96976.1 MAG: flagellar biosynthesis protein [Thermobacillus sp. ZCTH02-B1]
MADGIRIGHLYPAGKPPGIGGPAHVRKPPAGDAGVSFQAWLKASELKFSRHAEMRMQQRGISLKPEQLSEIASAIEAAEAKGAKDSLILYRGIAMIVNVPSKTVVTALDGGSAEGNVFTQIDSAVVIS